MTYKTYFDSPVGLLKITGNEQAISGISYVENVLQEDLEKPIPECLEPCLEELEEYFAKKRKNFTIKTMWTGTEFQQRVWEEMVKIPYASTSTYLAIALALGDRNAVRAVGMACKLNPIAIVGPCHRVLGTSGDLTGYNGGLDHKRDLLMLENPLVFGKQGRLF